MAKNLEENTINNGTTDTPLEDMINYIFDEFPKAEKLKNNKENPMYKFYDTTASKNIFATGIFDENLYTIKGSTGKGPWATIPCISILYNNITDTSKEGEYITYLLSSDRQSIYLCFARGTDEISNKFPKNNYQKTVNFLRNWAADVVNKVGSANTRGFDYEIRNMNLDDDAHIKKTDAKYYKSSVAFFKAYTKGNVPEEAELVEDLQCMQNIYQSYITKFRTDNNGNIIDLSFDIYMEDKFPQNNNSTNIGNESQKSNGNESVSISNRDKDLTEKDLGEILKKMYEDADTDSSKNKIAAYEIFGLRYGSLIKEKGYNIGNIYKESNISSITLKSIEIHFRRGKRIYKSLKNKDFEASIDDLVNILSQDNSETNINNEPKESNGNESFSISNNDKDLTEKVLGEILTKMCEEAAEKAAEDAAEDADEDRKKSITAAYDIFMLRYGSLIEEKGYKIENIVTETKELNSSENNLKSELNSGYNVYKALKNKDFGVSINDIANVISSEQAKNDTIAKNDTAKRVTGGANILYYGVPGAGKSYTIDKEIDKEIDRITEDKEIDRITKKDIKDSVMERVIFHPDYTYSDFVGQILPKLVPTKDNSDEKKLTYEFVPGPFTRILKKAIKHPENMYYLVIEEINRGNAPAIFGDIFQLLDRNKDGSGEYPITNSDIAREVCNDENKKVEMPSNLTIYATMNTSDQNVFTLDTAFQRRWQMKQVRNDVENADHADKPIDERSDITWGGFATVINKKIIDSNKSMISSEDKRLGAYFVKGDELEDPERFAEKVLKYLWDDAFKMNRQAVFKQEITTLEDLIDNYIKASEDPFKKIFTEGVYSVLKHSGQENNQTDENISGTEEDIETEDEEYEQQGEE